MSRVEDQLTRVKNAKIGARAEVDQIGILMDVVPSRQPADVRVRYEHKFMGNIMLRRVN